MLPEYAFITARLRDVASFVSCPIAVFLEENVVAHTWG